MQDNCETDLCSQRQDKCPYMMMTEQTEWNGSKWENGTAPQAQEMELWLKAHHLESKMFLIQSDL